MRAWREEDVDLMVDAWGNYPGPMVGFAFLLMNPVYNIAKYSSDLVGIVGDEEKLKGFLRMERWIADRPDHPGEVLRQWLRDLYIGNKLVKNELMLGRKRVDLRNITMPVLNIYAHEDVIVPPACSRPLNGRCGTGDYTEIEVPGGHIGTFVGSKAQKILGPAITDWLKARL
jgi:polyhydroxyalkanoate synthase